MTDYVLKAPFNLFDVQRASEENQVQIAIRYLEMIADSFPETGESNPDFRVMFLKELAARGIVLVKANG